jgi:GH18 family chitinase
MQPHSPLLGRGDTASNTGGLTRFGSWDKESNWIGPKVYGHTNLTVIKDALDLLWRNNVPANQVNLGLGFYGRYVLAPHICKLVST